MCVWPTDGSRNQLHRRLCASVFTEMQHAGCDIPFVFIFNIIQIVKKLLYEISTHLFSISRVAVCPSRGPSQQECRVQANYTMGLNSSIQDTLASKIDLLNMEQELILNILTKLQLISVCTTLPTNIYHMTMLLILNYILDYKFIFYRHMYICTIKTQYVHQNIFFIKIVSRKCQ
jgi:hypothetical protein